MAQLAVNHIQENPNISFFVYGRVIMTVDFNAFSLYFKVLDLSFVKRQPQSKKNEVQQIFCFIFNHIAY
jgi:hypothetical protein